MFFSHVQCTMILGSRRRQTNNMVYILIQDVILGHLLERYLNNQIYTYIGDILIAVNPFKQLDIYNSKVSLISK